MFIPSVPCTIIQPGPSDQYGHPSDGPSTRALCGVVDLTDSSVKTSIRTDASATRGSAREVEAKVRLLFTATTKIALDYIVEVGGVRVRVVTIDPQYTVVGTLDHYQVDCDDWSNG